jgi:polyisoprenoid-binding protein YceI
MKQASVPSTDQGGGAAHQRQNQISTPVTLNSHDPAASRAAMVCSKLNVTIKTESLQTQFAPRDKDLKGADWFNTTEFPEITYVGSQFAKKDDHTGTITGKLTLHGVAKPVTLDVCCQQGRAEPSRQD